MPFSFPIAGGIVAIRRWPAILTLVMLAGLLGLGTWQVERLHWKEDLLATIAVRMKTPPADVRELVPVYMRADGHAESSRRIAAHELEYRPAIATGVFMNDKEFYVTSVSLKGEGGYHVLTPMLLSDQRWLLVDRGWVPYDHKAPSSRAAGQTDEPVTIGGYVRVPHQNWLQRHIEPANNPEQNQWYRADLPAMALAAGIGEFMPFVLEADAAPNPGGYPVGGQTRMVLPNNHFVYALTWYGLALILAVVFILASWRKR